MINNFYKIKDKYEEVKQDRDFWKKSYESEVVLTNTQGGLINSLNLEVDNLTNEYNESKSLCVNLKRKLNKKSISDATTSQIIRRSFFFSLLIKNIKTIFADNSFRVAKQPKNLFLQTLFDSIPSQTVKSVFCISQQKYDRLTNTKLGIIKADSRNIECINITTQHENYDRHLDLYFNDTNFKAMITYRYQFVTTKIAYKTYREMAKKENLEPWSLSTIDRRIIKYNRIHRQFTHQSCKICLEYKEFTLKQSSSRVKDISKSEIHYKTNKTQRSVYLSQINNLTDESLVIVMDFSSMEFRNRVGHLCIVTYSLVNGERKVVFYDFFGQKTSCNHSYVISSLSELFRNGLLAGYSKIDIWTDGCSGQFKNRFFPNFLLSLSVAMTASINLNFFVTNHGHSISDAGQLHVKKAYFNNKPAQEPDPVCLGDFFKKLKPIKNHTFFLLPELIKDDIKTESEVKEISGITKCHRIQCDVDDSFPSFKLYIDSSTEIIQQTLKSNILSYSCLETFI